MMDDAGILKYYQTLEFYILNPCIYYVKDTFTKSLALIISNMLAQA